MARIIDYRKNHGIKLRIYDLNNNIIDTIECIAPLPKHIEEAKKKYPSEKYIIEVFFY